MRTARLVDADGGAVLVPRLVVAESRWDVTRGLLGRPAPAEGEAWWLAGCGSVHTWFMRYALDLAFVGADGAVARVAGNVGPWRMRFARGAVAVVELAAGGAARAGLAAGRRVRIVDR